MASELRARNFGQLRKVKCEAESHVAQLHKAAVELHVAAVLRFCWLCEGS